MQPDFCIMLRPDIALTKSLHPWLLYTDANLECLISVFDLRGVDVNGYNYRICDIHGDHEMDIRGVVMNVTNLIEWCNKYPTGFVHEISSNTSMAIDLIHRRMMKVKHGFDPDHWMDHWIGYRRWREGMTK